MAETHAVKAAEVGAGFRRGNHIVGRHRQLDTGQGDGHYLGAEFFQFANGVAAIVGDGAIQGVGKKLLRDADGQAADVLCESAKIIIHLFVEAGGVAMIMACHGLQHQRTILGALGHGAGLIQAGRKGNHAPAGHPPVGGLEAGNVVQGSGLADRAAGVGAGGARGQAGAQAGGRAAGGAAGNPFQVPRILHRPVVAGFIGGAHGELVHVGLAQHDSAFGGHFFHHGGGVGGNKVVQHF